MDDKKEKKLRNIITCIKFLILVAIILLIPLVIFFKHHEIIENFNSLEKLEMYLDKNILASAFIYIGFQIAQIVISIIPGQFLQIAGGYVFHFWIGMLFTIIGAVLGTFIAFYIARILGRDAMFLFFGKEKLNSYIEKLESKRAFLLIFIIYLIPGIPKDIFAYAIGVSEMNFIPFLIISMVGRIPAMMCSVMIGAMIQTGSYTGALILSICGIALFTFCMLKRKKINSFVDDMYVKIKGIS